MWCRLKRVTAPSKLASANPSAVASPTEKTAFPIPSAAASRRATSTIAGVMSTPCTSPTRGARPRATRPGPQAASSQRAPGAAGIRSTSRPSVSADRITGATLNDSDWWVNSRTTRSGSMAVFYRRRSPALTCDHLVTYDEGMDDDLVFKALADPTRRTLLDRLFTRDGRTLT